MARGTELRYGTGTILRRGSLGLAATVAVFLAAGAVSSRVADGPSDIERLLTAETTLTFETIETTLDNLLTFPCVKILVERGKLQLHGAYFGVAEGELSLRDPKTGVFEKMAD